MVVDDVRASDDRTDDRSVLADVCIFQPVDDARDQSDEHYHEHELK